MRDLAAHRKKPLAGRLLELMVLRIQTKAEQLFDLKRIGLFKSCKDLKSIKT